MLIEKLFAGAATAGVMLLTWIAGKTAVLLFTLEVNKYAHAANVVAAWGN